MGCGAAEVTGLGFVCFVINRYMLLNFFCLFHKIFNFTPPPPRFQTSSFSLSIPPCPPKCSLESSNLHHQEPERLGGGAFGYYYLRSRLLLSFLYRTGCYCHQYCGDLHYHWRDLLCRWPWWVVSYEFWGICSLLLLFKKRLLDCFVDLDVVMNSPNSA